MKKVSLPTARRLAVRTQGLDTAWKPGRGKAAAAHVPFSDYRYYLTRMKGAAGWWAASTPRPRARTAF